MHGQAWLAGSIVAAALSITAIGCSGGDTSTGGSSVTTSGGGTTGGGGSSSGGSSAFAVVDDCQQSDYVDQGSSATIQFGGTFGLTYSPKCTSVAAGASVTFTGALGSHPLTPGISSSVSGNAGSTPNPITATSTGTSVSFTFPSPGVYPYHCAVHQASGMYGAIWVK